MWLPADRKVRDAADTWCTLIGEKSRTPSQHLIHNCRQILFKLLFFSCPRQTSSLLSSPNNWPFSSSICTNGRRRAGGGWVREGGSERDLQGGKNTSAPQSCTVGTMLMSRVREGLRDWASELNYLITQFTKSPGLSPQEIWEAEDLGR